MTRIPSRAAARSNHQPHTFATPPQIYFTSCGTESDAWAIWGAVAARRAELAARGALPHVVTSAVEHPAVSAYLQALSEQGLIT